MQKLFCFRLAPFNPIEMALARLADENKIKFLRESKLEQEKLKLNSVQGKRLVPLFLDILNDTEDLEYVFIFTFFRFKNFQENFYFSAELYSAQTNLRRNVDGQPLPPEIGANMITKMRECLAKTREKILVEVKAQRIADSHGVFGWEAVKGINKINLSFL